MCLISLLALLFTSPAFAVDRPNILWITSEDMGPNLGCFGDTYATTPNLDALSTKSLRYARCWSNAPVCAPARTTIISGLYPTSTGSEHMRSLVPMPEGVKMFPQYLRQFGYYCTNNSKEDYNLVKPDGTWDESSQKVHYRNRKPEQSFFAVFNLTVSHESQIRTRPHTKDHTPSGAPIPPYHPDTPEVRQDWVQYHDKVAEMDRQAGKILKDLADDGLADETIVFYFSDHGSGMPRHKRCAQDSGLRVPLIIHFPENWKALAPKEYMIGGGTDRLVSFVDLAPSILSLLGVQPPKEMQGVPFLGTFAGEPRKYLHGFRGRMDERIDLVRSVRDERFVYVRNYMPHLPKGQHVGYMFQTPTTRVWKRLFDEGRLNEVQSAFWKPKPPEELYDLRADPFETRNLANDQNYQDVLNRLRQEQRDQVLRVRDVGLLPEAEMHRRSGTRSPYDFAHEASYPVDRVRETAELASSLEEAALPELGKRLKDADSGVRYWAVMGLLMRGPKVVEKSRAELESALEDKVPAVRIAAAEALLGHGGESGRTLALPVLLEHSNPVTNGPFAPVQALNALEPLRANMPKDLTDQIRKLPEKAPDVPARNNEYVARMKAYYLGTPLKE